jgi:hypothetical protein
VALRVATSSVGNYEAGFALAALCERAEAAGLDPGDIRAVGLRAVMERLT